MPLLRFWLASALDFCNTSSLPGEVCCSCGALRLALPVGPFFFSFFFFPSFLKGWHCDLPLSQSCGISALRCRAVTPPLASPVSGQLLSSRREPIRCLTSGFEALTDYASALEPYPAIPSLLQPEGSILPSPRFLLGMVLCSKASALSFTRGLTSLFSNVCAETSHSSQNACNSSWAVLMLVL